jgi:hypothetical protein
LKHPAIRLAGPRAWCAIRRVVAALATAKPAKAPTGPGAKKKPNADPEKPTA